MVEVAQLVEIEDPQVIAETRHIEHLAAIMAASGVRELMAELPFNRGRLLEDWARTCVGMARMIREVSRETDDQG